MKESCFKSGMIAKCAIQKRKNRLLNQNTTEKYLSGVKKLLNIYPDLNICTYCWKVTTSLSETVSEHHPKSHTTKLTKIFKKKSINSSFNLMEFINSLNPKIKKDILEEIQVASINEGVFKIRPFGYGGDTSCQEEYKLRLEFMKKNENVPHEVTKIDSKKVKQTENEEKKNNIDENKKSCSPINLLNDSENLNPGTSKNNHAEISPVKKVETHNLEENKITNQRKEPDQVFIPNINSKYVLEKDCITQNSKLNKKIEIMIEKNAEMNSDFCRKIEESQTKTSKEFRKKLEEFKNGDITRDEVLKLIQDESRAILIKTKEIITDSENKSKELIENINSDFYQRIAEIDESLKEIKKTVEQRKENKTEEKKSLSKDLILNSLFDDEKTKEVSTNNVKKIKDKADVVELINEKNQDDSSFFLNDED